MTKEEVEKYLTENGVKIRGIRYINNLVFFRGEGKGGSVRFVLWNDVLSKISTSDRKRLGRRFRRQK